MLKKSTFLLPALLGLALSGCATNPYQQFYIDNTHGKDISTSHFVIPPPKEPKLMHGDNQNADTQRMLEEGYFMIGYSHFNESQVSDSEAINFGKKLHAAMILVYSHYTNTVTEMMAETIPETKIIETTGHRFYSGRAHDDNRRDYSMPQTTTITEFDTAYVPYNVDRYDYIATYWVQGKPPILGICPKNLSADDRNKIGTNKGVVVLAVVTGSPAFQANVFKGDIVTKINDQEIIDLKAFIHTVVSYQGQKAVLTILRNGQILSKEIQLSIRE